MNVRFAPRWLVPAAAGAGVFLLIAADVFLRGPLFHLDMAVSEPLYAFGKSRPALHAVIVFVTNLGAGDFITAVGCLNVIVFLARRDWQAAVVFAVGLSLIRPIIWVLKLQFSRVRPAFLELTDFSFPSGHAFGSAAVYGTTLFLAWHLGRGHRWRWPAVCVLGTLITAIAASRPLYGAHFVSDVLAGMVLGLAYVCAMVAAGNPRALNNPV